MNAPGSSREAAPGLPRWVIAIAVITALRGLAAVLIPVLPEEAYHWCYARHPALGYYDHPPMIAWMIGLGRLIFGDTAVGVRLLPWLASLGTSVAAAWTARRLYGETAAMWTAILMALQPGMFLATSFGVPDCGMLLFWSLGVLFAVEALQTRRGAWWLAAGGALGAALLSKYTAGALAGSLFLYLLFSPRDRFWLKTPWPYLGLLLAALVFSPVVVWNATHEWASFRFQSVGRLEESKKGFQWTGGLAYLLLQWGAVVPLTAPLAFVAVRSAVRERSVEDRLLLWLSLPLLFFFFCIGFKRSTHVFWPLPAWIGLSILMGGTLARAGGRIVEFYRVRWPILAAVSSVALGVALVHAVRPLPGLPPMRSLYGWEAICRRAEALRAPLPPGSFYLGIGRRYLCPAQLAFHLNAPAEVQAKNLLGEDGLQFAYWANLSELKGRAAVIVSEADWAPQLEDQLRRCFDRVEKAGELPALPHPDRPPGPKEERYIFHVGYGYHPVASP
jgi:dolichol-phosphate mannosyltransferase